MNVGESHRLYPRVVHLTLNAVIYTPDMRPGDVHNFLMFDPRVIAKVGIWVEGVAVSKDRYRVTCVKGILDVRRMVLVSVDGAEYEAKHIGDDKPLQPVKNRVNRNVVLFTGRTENFVFRAGIDYSRLDPVAWPVPPDTASLEYNSFRFPIQDEPLSEDATLWVARCWRLTVDRSPEMLMLVPQELHALVFGRDHAVTASHASGILD